MTHPSVLRTPEERFHNLRFYPWPPKYLDIDDADLGPLLQHYLDEGPRDGPLVLLMHGEPTWSYLYRKMIPPLVGAGFRILAPDLIGFGKSDKPTDRRIYSYRRHVDWMRQFLRKASVTDATLFCQDWGGLIGLRLVAAEPERFKAVVASNTVLPLGAPLSKAFMTWRRFARWSPLFRIGKVIDFATVKPLSPDTRAAYDAPFPNGRYKAAARAFPQLVPISPDDPGAVDNRVAWSRLQSFDSPFLTLFGDSDPVTRGWDRKFQDHIQGARNQPHRIINGAGHFIQEDAGEELAAALIAFSQSPRGVS